LGTFKSFGSVLYSANNQTFDKLALSLFRFQANNNPLYKAFIDLLSIDTNAIQKVGNIPFMPISFFKTNTIKTGDWKTEIEFQSSGTTGQLPSKHHLLSNQFYLDHALRCFQHFFGDVSNYHFLGYLPSYLERKNSSLIAMIDWFIKKSGSSVSGFYLNNEEKLLKDIENLRGGNRKIILWGVSFALLDLVEKYQPDLSHCMVFETGGMKGRRKEITRQELHSLLKKGLNVDLIYSEYGMTELLSQAYSLGKEFRCSPWMKVIARELSDPFEMGLMGETGALNVIDLANWHSIAFIETEDLGKVYQDGLFEVSGRIDNSDVRGCNLLIE
jgi:hypothetical protein